MKLWNIEEGRPFTSYQLEQMIVEQGFYSCLFIDSNLQSYFYNFVDSLSSYWNNTNKQNQAVQKLKNIVDAARQYEHINCPLNAEMVITSLFE